MLTIESISKALTEYRPACFPTLQNSYAYVDFFPNGAVLFSRDCIYIGKASCIMPYRKILDGSGLIIVSDIELDPSSLCADVIMLPASVDIQAVFCDVEMLLASQSRLEKAGSALTKLLVEERGISALVCETARYLRNPVLFFDVSSRMLAASPMNKIVELAEYDETLREMLQEGNASNETLLRLNLMGSWEQIIRSQRPFVIGDGYFSTHRRMFMRAEAGNSFMGYLVAIEADYQFNEDCATIFKFAADLLGIECRRSGIGGGDYDPMTKVFLYALDHRDCEPEKLKQMANSLGVEFFPYYCFINIRTNDEGVKKTDYEDILALKSYFTDPMVKVRAAVYNGEAFLILNIAQPVITPALRKQIEEMLRKKAYIGGISDVFSDISQAIKCVNQAVQACKYNYCLDGETLYEYRQVYVYHVLSRITSEKEIQELIYSGILNLMSYDEKNETDYCLTLRVFFEETMNIPAAASKMYIHRNTMSYRIKKIEEITGLDLENMDDCVRAVISLKMVEMFN